MKRKVLSTLLSLALIFTSVDFNVFAVEQTSWAESEIGEQSLSVEKPIVQIGSKNDDVIKQEEFEEDSVFDHSSELLEEILSEGDEINMETETVSSNKINESVENTIEQKEIQEIISEEIGATETEVETTKEINDLTAEIVETGQCGDDLTWTYTSDGTLTISGTGKMYNKWGIDYYSEKTPWKYCDIRVVIIEDNVTSIGQYAFYGCDELVSVTIPNSVTSIGQYAFKRCSSLISAGPIGEGYDYEFGWTNTIPSWAFYGCSALTNITIPSGITAIGDCASSYSGGAFGDCSALTNIIIPDSVTSIGNNTFGGCSALTSIIIPDSVTNIGDCAFVDCNGLTSIIMSDNVTNIGDNIFAGCNNLTSAGPIGGDYNYEFGWTKIIPSNAFAGCSGLISIKIPDGVTAIGEKAFKNCSGLTTVKIPNSVTRLGYRAFWYCTGLKKIKIHKELTNIFGAFEGCSGLTSAGPIGGGYDYEFGWTDTVPGGAFLLCNNLTNITIPKGITSIGEKAFTDCSELTNIIMPQSVININYSAFQGCSKLVSAGPIGKGYNYEFGWTKTIPNCAFHSCNNLETITIPESVTKIGDSAFVGTDLSNIIIPESVTSIGTWAFGACDNSPQIVFRGNAFSMNIGSIFDRAVAKIYYPSWKTGWEDIVSIDNDGTLTWIPYDEGTEPWLMNTSETAPQILTSFKMPSLQYHPDTGYSTKVLNMDMSVSYGYVVGGDSPNYENVKIVLELPQGISFSSEKEVTEFTDIIGEMGSVNTKKDLSYQIYVTASGWIDELPIIATITADGYETPQIYTYSIPVKLDYKEKESSIIDVVSRYTNQEEAAGGMALFEDLRNHNYSDEEAQKKFFEYFCCDNWTSVFEQITFLEDSQDERWAYNGLISDEMYIAWQYQNYLNNTTKGQYARAALWTSGLVFNGELDAYLEPATYLNSDLPGIKDYKSMLKEFIGKRTAQIETYSYIKEAENILQSSVGIWSDLEKEAVLKKIKKVGDKETCKTIFNDFVAEKMDVLGIEGTELVFVTKGNTPKFIQALDITGDIFTITNMTVDFATQMADVSANIEIYDTWHSFLVEISNAKDLPWEMRAAAYQLDKEMEQTYMTPIQNVFNKVRDKCINKALSATVWKEVVSLGGYTDTLNISASIINAFVDMGALIVNSKKTEGYAYLANHYKTKLQNCKTAFLNNKSAENAWAFYEAYVMLHSLRVAGEEQFLKMSQLQGNDIVDGLSECATGGTIGGLISDLCGYQDKKACVDEILKRLETFKFQYDLDANTVPDEYKYLQKVVVRCPVSVEFLTDDGTSIYKLEDKTEYDVENEYGHFRAFYNPADGDYIKIGYFKSLNPVQVVAIGQEDGDITYTQAVTNDNITCDITGFAKQKVVTDEVIKINTAENTYVIDIKGDGKTVIEAPKADASKTFVQFDYDNRKTIEIKYTDSEGRVQIPDAPQKENADFLGWYTEKNGNGDAFTEQSIVSSSITVYAHWGTGQEDNNEKLLPPVSDYESGSSIRQGTCITLSSEENAIIYYTVDGTAPTTNSLLYSEPIVVNTDIIIQAIATKEGYRNSDIAIFIYTIAQGQHYIVTFNSNGGTDISSQTVQESGKVTEPPAPIREGYIFTGWYLNGVLYNFDTEVISDIVLEAGWIEYGKVAMPTPSIASGSIVASGTRLRLISSEGAKIYYTIDETIPTVSSTLFTEDILITQHIVIKAFAVQEGFKDSDIATFIYDISASDNPNDMGDVLLEDIPESGIPNGLWIAGIKDMTYTGKAIKPSVRVYDYKTRLTEKRDYTISYKNNINVNDTSNISKAPSVIITAKGNYSGKETATFKILAKDINSTGFDIADIAANPNKKVQNPVPVVTFNGKKLSNKKDFTITYPDISADAYKEKGTYAIKIAGKGNYTGEKTIKFIITDNNLITKAKVSKISDQQYTGKALTPDVQIKYGKTVLNEGTDYELEYHNNTEIGTANVIIKSKGGYSGQKTVSFKIAGAAINKGKVTGLDTPSIFNGNEITKNFNLVVTVDGSQRTLKAGQDYTIAYQNNKNVGKATVILTGINGYSGTLKKTFKISAYDLQADTNKKVSYSKNLSVPYAKNGSCPDPVIYFGETKLEKGRDYSLSYKNNKAVNSGINSATAPMVIVKGKGNFTGTLPISFVITSQNMSSLALTAGDKEYKNRANIFATNITVTDINGKALSAGKDYDKNSIAYSYANNVTLENGMSKKAGDIVEKTDIIPVGTKIQVAVTAKAGGYYTGTVKGTYRIIKSDVKKAKVSIPAQTYTGKAIIPEKSDINVAVGGTKLTESEFEIVSCSNNIKKGNASITIKGKGNYGGSKTVKFTIKSKGFLWWWRK